MDLALTTLFEAAGILTSPVVLFFVLVAVLWGSACGLLPGVGTALALGVMLPLTFSMEPVTAVAFLVAISVSVSFGNSPPAVVIGVPGTGAAVLSALDGYALSKRGETGLALATAWFGAVIGQLISIPFFVLLVVPLSTLSYVFLSPEMFALYLLGLTALVSLTGENVLKGLAAAALGLTVAFIGPDPISAVPRFSFGISELAAGVKTIPAVLGLVTISELIRSMRQVYGWDDLAHEVESTFPGFGKLRRTVRPIFTGSLIGTLLGAVPGMGSIGPAVMSYQQAKLTSKHPEEFGKGSVEGLAANESAQNAAQAGEMVPTLGLGIPGSDSMVLVLGALTLHGFVPGPTLIQRTPELLHATVAGLLGGSLILLAIGWPLGKLLLKGLRVDRRVVLPIAFVVTHVGIYSLSRSVFDVLVLLVFGVVGYFMIRYGYPTAAAALGLLLGAGFESNLRQGLLLVDSDPVAFVTRPWTLAILLLALALFAYGVYGTVKSMRRQKAILAASRLDQSGKR